ncbi:PfkB family carbohydrate kinase [Lachnospiraceae bacterium ZAX-1]
MGKIVTKKEYIDLKLELEGKSVILCHGVFDLVHPGHVIHFEEAKALGDILVVSVTAEKYVRKGPGRPYFKDDLRLKFLSALEPVDYVMLSENYTVDDIIEIVEPDFYVKGQEYAKAEDDITGKIKDEVELVRSHGGDVYYTSGEVFSSTKLINRALPSLPDEVKAFVGAFKRNYSFDDIKYYMEKIEHLKILVIGDVILDEYVYCHVQGLMSKDMGYSTRYKRSEQYLGGSVAIAKHVASFNDNVSLMSVVGHEEAIHSRLLNELSSNMRLALEYSDKFETIIKQRFVTENEKREELHKIFAINNLPMPVVIDEDTMVRFRCAIKEKIEPYDLVLLCDFGHGLIDAQTMEIIQEKAKFLAINCQTNSSNHGLNLITKYHRADAFTLDQQELKLAMKSESLDEKILLQQLAEHLHAKGWLTRGAKGAVGVSDKEVHECPAMTLQVKDTIGAGDAFFSVASLCATVDAPVEIGTFMGNIAGALAANIIGNKESIDKVNVLKYASTVLNI